MLRDSSLAGRLSDDTFLRRVDSALRARRVDELSGLLSDLPPVPGEGAGPGRHITVSWHHAELRRGGQAWVLVDLGSKNGTRVNGWRVDSGFTVRAGDRVSFGAAVFRLADPA